MRLRKLAVFMVLALVSAIGIGYWSTPIPLGDKLIRIQAEQTLGVVDRRILDEPLEVQAMLLDYLGSGEFDPRTVNGQLVTKTWIAIAKYPAETREILQQYGSQAEFQAVLREYGECVIPVIKYFLVNDLLTLKAMNAVGSTVNTAKLSATSVWNKLTGSHQTPAAPPTAKAEYGPAERGWYAIHAIQKDGHKFLGQFALDKNNVATWNQTDRAASAVTGFLTGGISNLERKYELNETIGSSDIFFAAIDVMPFVAAVKVLKFGKAAAATGKELSLVSKTRAFGSRLIPKSPFLRSLGGLGAKLAVGYIAISNPGLINSMLREIATSLGINPMMFQIACWFAFLSVALYPLSWLIKLVANAVLAGGAWLNASSKSAMTAARDQKELMASNPSWTDCD